MTKPGAIEERVAPTIKPELASVETGVTRLIDALKVAYRALNTADAEFEKSVDQAVLRKFKVADDFVKKGEIPKLILKLGDLQVALDGIRDLVHVKAIRTNAGLPEATQSRMKELAG